MNRAVALTILTSLVLSTATAASGASRSRLTTSVRIGVEAPLSGSQSGVGRGILDGALLAAQQLNAGGGINGEHVTIVPIDDRATPSVGAVAAKAALASGLQGIVGPYNSGVGLVTLPKYIRAGLLPIRFTSANATQGLGYTLQPMTSQIAPVATRAITTWAKVTSVALIYDNTQSYTEAANTAMQADLAAAHVTVTSDVAISPGASDYQAAVASAEASYPQLIYIITYYPEAGLIARAIHQGGAAPKCLADFGAYDNHYITAAGVAAARACPVVGVPAPGDFGGSAKLVAQYRATFHQVPGAWSPYAFDSLMTLARAATKAHSFIRGPLMKALDATSWTGWTGPVAFQKGSGNRLPPSVTVDYVNAAGVFHVDASWVAAVGAVL